ncbi:MAG: DUF3253 domain-containing protein [Cyclobacteriaceae bacterium]|nr:DUF3253 domain-containing protein [Cyclobacteriaceae bacterium]MDH4297323.1 DUF3253 domain-containing protein [Cyclobacteriaceae bacterium]MDH5250308.1 DUF3253 domain-containing protein [Cyclobacteriaceae bacterium]
MVFAEDIRRTILKLAEERGPEQTFAMSDVARAMDQKNWRELLDQVKFVANILIREGKIIARKSNGNSSFELSKPPITRQKS